MAYIQEIVTSKRTRYKMVWRSRDPKTGKSKLRTKAYSGQGSKADAQKEARRLEAEDNRRPLTTEGDGTIRGFLISYEPSATANLSYATKRSIGWALNKLKLWVGDTQISKFSPLTLANVARFATNEGLAQTSQQKIYRTFKKAMLTAVTWQLAPYDAALAFTTFTPPKVPKKMPPIRTIEDSEQLATELRPHTPDFADMVILAAYTGMRYGEIAALDFGQVNLDRGRLTVDRTITKGPNGYVVKLSPKTDAGRRIIPLAPEAMEVLRGRLGQLEQGMVFPAKANKPYNPGSPAFAIGPIAKRLNIPTGFHASRHYWASLMISRGITMPEVSRLLGHASPAVTMSTYAWCISDPAENDAVLAALSGSGESDDRKTG